MDAPFKKAVLFRDARCPEIAEKCLEAFASYGLRPAQIKLQHSDDAFNYELSFSLFNGNATFKASAERLHVEFHSAGDRDLEILGDCVVKTYGHVPFPEIARTIINANAHAVMSSVDELLAYLQQFAQPEKGIAYGGAIALVRCEPWPQEIRVSVEKSLIYPAGLYLTWTTHHQGSKLSRDSLSIMARAVEESAAKLGLVLLRKKP